MDGLGGTRGASFIVRAAAHKTSTRHVPEKRRWVSIRNVRGFRQVGKRIVLEMSNAPSITCCDAPDIIKIRMLMCREFVAGARDRKMSRRK